MGNTTPGGGGAVVHPQFGYPLPLSSFVSLWLMKIRFELTDEAKKYPRAFSPLLRQVILPVTFPGIFE